MTQLQTPPVPHAPVPAPAAPPVGLLGHLMNDRRFLGAAAVLVVLIGGWYAAIAALNLAMDKQPVPWPAGVEVDKDFVLTSFPELLPSAPGVPPRYVLMSSKRLEKAAWPVERAVVRLPEDIRLELDVGKPLDAPRWSNRASNWYMQRVYGDWNRDSEAWARLWQLDQIYYTGEADTVAHVPGRCMIAAGARQLGADKVLEWDVPENALGWKTVKVVRSAFERTLENGTQSNVVQYYTFSVNGENEWDWKQVRWTLSASLRQKHVYFGKIQFAPLVGDRQTVENLEKADEAARRFFTAFAVDALSKFPSAQAVAELNQSDKPATPAVNKP